MSAAAPEGCSCFSGGRSFASLAALVGALLLRLPGSDDEALHICEASAWLKDDRRGLVLGTRWRIRSYVEGCLQVFATLEPEPRERLLRRWRQDRLAGVLTMPAACPPHCDAKKLPPTRLATCGKAWPLKQNLGWRGPALRRAGLRPLQERTVDLSALPARQLFSRGEVARFDAKQVLPRRLFNITLQDLGAAAKNGVGSRHTALHSKVYFGARRHGGMQYEGHSRCQDWLLHVREVANRVGAESPSVRLLLPLVVHLILHGLCHPAPRLTEVAELSKGFSEAKFQFGVENASHTRQDMDRALRLVGQNRGMLNSNVNTRNLPGLMQGVDLAERLGLGDLVEQTHSFLWLGLSHGVFHVDVQDNILVQLAGTAEALVIPPNCTLKSPTLKQVYAGGVNYLRRSDWGEVPFFHIELVAGEGVVIPSGSLHRVIAHSSHRIAINAFFEPRFGRMQWPAAYGNRYKLQPLDYLALRGLWLRTLRKLWDEHQVSMVMHTAKLEFI